MSIRNKILLYFSTVTIVMVGIAMFFIYTLFYEFREEEFQQREKERIMTTLRFLTEVRSIEENLIDAIDRISIHDLYDEKLLLFDKNKRLIYASIDDTQIPFSADILSQLSPEKTWIETKDGLYDVVGVYVENNGNMYYGIGKAYDISGYSKLNYLKYVLTLTFLGISLVVIGMSYYLSKKITQSIVSISRQIKDINFDEGYTYIRISEKKGETALLANRFNELMERMNKAFAFQKHATHHISHELKTPIAVLVSNFEKMEKETDPGKLKVMIAHQKDDTKSLSEIIHALLEIAKTDAGRQMTITPIRVDELIFDLVDELSGLHPDFRFSVEYQQHTDDENYLTVRGNPRLLKAAFSNLMMNCVQYSSDQQAKIQIRTGEDELQVGIVNAGPVISEKEQQYLFQHFFRGENSKGKRGFGLGLVFVHKILSLHNGRISYMTPGGHTNIFTVSLPLR